MSPALKELERINAILQRTPKAVDLHQFAKGRFVAAGSAITDTLDLSGNVYEWTGSAFVRTSVLTPSARDRALRERFWNSDGLAFHCPNWIALDAPVNALVRAIHKTAMEWFGGPNRLVSIRFMNMDIAIMSIFKDLARGKPAVDAATTAWPAMEKIVKHDGMTGHDLMAIQAELMARIEDIEAAYRDEIAARGATSFRKRRRRR